jgi:hypothetical protein
MAYTYANCYKITGPAICESSVNNLAYTYEGCKNLSGNAYFIANWITNVTGCFKNRNTSRRLNIYVPNKGDYNSDYAKNTANTCFYNNTMSLVGENITWTKSGVNYYNTAFNIYVYLVANVRSIKSQNGD